MLVFVFVSVCLPVCPQRNITINSLNVGRLLQTFFCMKIAGYDICIIDKYHGNRSKVKVTEIVKNT